MKRLMGILNATPDSFYTESRFNDLNSAVQRGIQIYEESADIIDIGGESTRPNAAIVSEDEELKRVIPLIKTLKSLIPIPISIDTSKPKVADAAIAAGASFINDVAGFRHNAMRQIAAETGVEICVMHMKDNPQTMQQNPFYPNGIINHLVQWFDQQIEELLAAGIKKNQIILDPGIGFGKTVADNLEIIHNLHKFKALGFPVLLGISRKSFLSKILNKPTADLLYGTIAVNAMALLADVDIIRVHDVKEHRDVIKIMDYLKHA